MQLRQLILHPLVMVDAILFDDLNTCNYPPYSNCGYGGFLFILPNKDN